MARLLLHLLLLLLCQTAATALGPVAQQAKLTGNTKNGSNETVGGKNQTAGAIDSNEKKDSEKTTGGKNLTAGATRASSSSAKNFSATVFEGANLTSAETSDEEDEKLNAKALGWRPESASGHLHASSYDHLGARGGNLLWTMAASYGSLVVLAVLCYFILADRHKHRGQYQAEKIPLVPAGPRQVKF
eukprot:TRINITY_DN5393_c0_g1_i2.p1 TRINITY_DN5393_c0_g1~~TRINITY_DN5393_c0_g1_i2.p1  ORF type:complete len:188 (-),score=32.40 TRINITY_DN5393_c0_g1_i2:47-610(-)